MSTSLTRVAELDAVAAIAVRGGAARAAAVAAVWREAGGFVLACGAHGAGPQGPIDERAIFDLASVSKSFVALAAARVARRGLLTLSDTIARWLPQRGADITLELCLAHRAGLESHRPLFAPLQARLPFDREQALTVAASARRAECAGPPPPGGHPPVYSDLGYVLAGAVLERTTGLELDRVVQAEVSDPLGLDASSARQAWARDPDFGGRVLPTEHVIWRGGELRGVVHDENAWALAGHGLAGQAGLFGTVESVARLGASVLDAMAGRRLDWLVPAEVRVLVDPRPGGSLRAGFDGKSGSLPSAGHVSSAATFGHLGFTGTSFWCDPAAETVAVLLTNRVCPTRENQKIREVRPVVHDALFRYAQKRGLPSGGQP
jgi:serine-type D-Ala-D-Ala carboxypeptidase